MDTDKEFNVKNLASGYQAGYRGKGDVLREKAERLLGKDHSAIVKMPMMESFSAPGHTKRRFYKDGGHINKHALNKEQVDLVLPRQKKTPKFVVRTVEAAQRMKEGGMKKGGRKARMADGGALGEIQSMARNSRSLPFDTVQGGMKRGGVKKSEGGKMSKGGKMKGCFDGGQIQGAHKGGATSYPMVGERGKKASVGKSYAMGGPGKQRKGEMSKSGKPVARKGK